MSVPGFGQYRECVDRIVSGALHAADPASLMSRALAKFPPHSPSGVIAVGKAAAGMYAGYERLHGEPARRVMVSPRGAMAPQWALRGEHPAPGEGSVRAAEAVREFVAHESRDGGVVLLLSGGASALAALPAAELTLDDLRAVTDGLLRAGADIRELNWVRKHLEQLKGGRLAAMVSPRPLDVYVLSDVIGDDLAIVGSGPAWPDGSTFADAIEILERRGVEAPAAMRYLREGAEGQHADTPKPGDPVFRSVRTGVIGNNADAVRGAAEAAEEMGFTTKVLSKPITGEAAAQGSALARMLPPRGRACLIGGGETTVKVGKSPGRGGRNQELVLRAALEIEDRDGVVVVSFATDGVDGPTEAAGAVVTGRTCQAARSLGMHPGKALQNHDSYGFFSALERVGEPCLIRTGPTGTNVNDVTVAMVF